MKIATMQLDIRWEDRPENYRRVSRFAAEAADEGADLFVLPEMFATGFSMNPSITAEPKGGSTHRYLSDLAKDNEMAVIGGMVFNGDEGINGDGINGDGGKGINAAVAFDRQGTELACYAKSHLISIFDEQQFHIPGDGPTPFEIEGVRFSCFICYDLRFPELFRLAAKETDVAVVIASWPDARQQHFERLLEARAIENQHFVVGVNRVGSGGDLNFVGGSAIYDPFGERIADAGDSERLVVTEIDLQKIAEFRAFMACHEDRRF